VGRGGQRNRGGPETAEDERWQKARDEARDEESCSTAAVPVKRGFGTGFVPLGFLCTARLSKLANSREKAWGRAISRCFAWSSRIMEESTSSRRNSAREGDIVTSVAGVRLVIT
jgi:hypothetical protein